MSELKITTQENIDLQKDDVQLVVNGAPVHIQVMSIVETPQKKSLEEELKEAYIALEEDRKELNADWDITTGEQWE